MRFMYKIFEQGSDRLLAISDPSILGKTFEEGELSVTVAEDFYHENKCSDKEALALIRNATIVNAIGKDIVSLMIREKIVNKESVLKIKGVPHAQVVAVK